MNATARALLIFSPTTPVSPALLFPVLLAQIIHAHTRDGLPTPHLTANRPPSWMCYPYPSLYKIVPFNEPPLPSVGFSGPLGLSTAGRFISTRADVAAAKKQEDASTKVRGGSLTHAFSSHSAHSSLLPCSSHSSYSSNSPPSVSFARLHVYIYIQVLSSDKRLPCPAASQRGIGLLGDLGDVLGKTHLSLDEELECVLV